MKNKVGVITSTYAYFSTEEALDGLSRSGFKYAELITMPGFVEHISLNPEDVEGTLDMCKKYGVELFCIAGHGRLVKEGSVDNFKKVIDTANLMNVDYINTDTGEVKNESDKRTFYKEIKLLGDYAADKGVTIGLEIHGDWCRNGKIASEIVKKINHPSIKITYDTGNTIFYGGTRPEDDINYAIPFMGYIHIKDKRGGYRVWDFPALGEGDVDFDKIFNLLKDYSGPMSVEVELDGKKHPISEVNNAVKCSYYFLEGYGLV